MINREKVLWPPLFAAILLQGCAMADLRPATLKEEGIYQGAALKAAVIYEEALGKIDPRRQWDDLNEVRIVAVDEWRSIFRLLTPVKGRAPRLEFTFFLKSDLALMSYLDGSSRGETIGIEKGVSFRLKNDERIIKKSRKTALYLDPVRDYYLWPFSLSRLSTRIYIGDEKVGGKLYSKIFVTSGSLKPGKTDDQYVLWIEQDSQTIRMIEFTLRELTASYRGVVHYDDFRWTQGMYLPHEIILNESISRDKYSHRFIVEGWEFR